MPASLLEKNRKALKLIETPARRFAARGATVRQRAGGNARRDPAYLESLGVASVDINMGCPVRKVCKVGGGSAMMTELDKTRPRSFAAWSAP